MRPFWFNFRRAIARVIPACLTQAQAVAFNMFLSFFPALLFGLGVLSSWTSMKEAAGEIPRGLESILPPGSHRLVVEFLLRRDPHPWKLIWLGLIGTLLVGTQVMQGLMEGFWVVWADHERPSYWRRYIRALILLCMTMAPWLATAVLTVFGRQVRRFIIEQVGLPLLIQALWTLFYYAATLVVAMLVLVVIYRVARPACRRWNQLAPGATVATVLWWVLNAGLGVYVRNMPYSVVYGSLAAVIGLMVWMYLTALVVITGAAYNAELDAAPAVINRGRRAA